MDGVIVINKPAGMTSHTVVSKVRRIINMKRVGHTGTLDPDAQGVLPICVGKGTKTANMLTDIDKQYRAVMHLGLTTDTQDASGAVLSTSLVNATPEDILNAIHKFVGEIEQIPPMYSAIKQNGKKLYELARAGIEVERKPRKVSIYSITDIKIEGEFVEMLIDCSKGTYIRTLCHDIGNVLGCGGIMHSLIRTKSGGFSLDDSYTLQQLEELGEKCLVTLNELFSDYDEFIVDELLENKVKNGVPLEVSLQDGLYRVLSKSGELLCVSEYKNGMLTMLKSFWGEL